MAETRCSVAFGPFQLFAAERRLEREGNTVPLGSRAFDLLSVLVEHPGEVVIKRELLSQAWPRLSVDESNLRSQIVCLRRALGEDAPHVRYITTIPGRGYCFVAPTTIIKQETPTGRDAPPPDVSLARSDSQTDVGVTSDALAERLDAANRLTTLKTQVAPGDLVSLIEICRKLDNVAAAIELAVGRVNQIASTLYGPRGLSVS